MNGKSDSFHCRRKRRPCDPESPSGDAHGCGTDSCGTSKSEQLSYSRNGKRKPCARTVYVKRRSKIRSTESFKFFHRLTSDLYDHDDAEEFQIPVLKKYKSDDVPGYEDAVSNPMDLGTVKNNLNSDAYVGKCDDNGFYFDESECLSDLRLVFQNCKKYNEEESSLYKAADVFLKLIDTRLQQRSAHAQRASGARQVGSSKSRNLSERPKRNAAASKARTTSNRGSKTSTGLDIVREQPTSESEQRQDDIGKRDAVESGSAQIAKEESSSSSRALFICPSTRTRGGASRAFSQNACNGATVCTSMQLRGSAPQIVSGSALMRQSQDRLQNHTHYVPQSQSSVVGNQHPSLMAQPNFTGDATFTSTRTPPPGSNVTFTPGHVPVKAGKDEGKVICIDEDSENNGDDGDGKASSSRASSDGNEDETNDAKDVDDLDQQDGDKSHAALISTNGMDEKRDPKSVRVAELERQRDSLLKRHRQLRELSVEFERQKQLQMLFSEKKKLCEDAAELDYERMKRVVEILARGMGRPEYINEIDLDLDIDFLDNSVLREIQFFLKNPSALTAKENLRQTESQILDIEYKLFDLRNPNASPSTPE